MSRFDSVRKPFMLAVCKKVSHRESSPVVWETAQQAGGLGEGLKIERLDSHVWEINMHARVCGKDLLFHIFSNIMLGTQCLKASRHIQKHWCCRLHVLFKKKTKKHALRSSVLEPT